MEKHDNPEWLKHSHTHCPWCGGELKLQPGPLHREDGNTFCNTTCAYIDRLSKQPVEKQYQ